MLWRLKNSLPSPYPRFPLLPSLFRDFHDCTTLGVPWRILRLHSSRRCSGKHWALGNCQGQTSVLYWNKICFTSLLVNLLPRCRCINQVSLFLEDAILFAFFFLWTEIGQCHFQSWWCMDCTTLKCKLVPFWFLECNWKQTSYLAGIRVTLLGQEWHYLVIAWPCCSGWAPPCSNELCFSSLVAQGQTKTLYVETHKAVDAAAL